MAAFQHVASSLITNYRPAYVTQLGASYIGDSRTILADLPDACIDLVVTSPPFALLRQKEYGNKEQAEYVEWLGTFAKALLPKLKSTGSLVVDIGGAYEKGKPTRSLYPFRVPIYFCDILGYHLAEDFYWYNSAKLPSPIEWVNKRKIRAKDAVNNIWWFSKTPWPQADVSQVLTEYSERMKKLLQDPGKYYDPKKRPSGHDIGTGFAIDNGGAIPSNLLQIPNSESSGQYITACKLLGVKSHPAKFPSKLPEFFIKMLTKPGDLVFDIFAGSNTTGDIAEKLGRRWISCDLDAQYTAGSVLRFLSREQVASPFQDHPYQRILAGEVVDLREKTTSVIPSDNPLRDQIDDPLTTALEWGQQLHFMFDPKEQYTTSKEK